MLCQIASLDPGLRLLQIPEEGHIVVEPLVKELCFVGELAARDLHRDLHGAPVEVVEVLHAAGDGVPLGAVRHAVVEVVAAVPRTGHVVVIAGVGLGHAEELFMVWNQKLKDQER